MRILVVEDDDILREFVCDQLRARQFTVECAVDGREGLYQATEYPLDVAVIDLGLPYLSGVELIRGVRTIGIKFPILILTARDRWQDKVEGLEAGADDYLVKPFHIEELLARLRALLRRAAGWTQPVLACGPLKLEAASQKASLYDRTLALTDFEYRILEYLMLHAGEIVSKARLSDTIYTEDKERDSNVIEVFIRRLRLKLDPEGALNPIETLRGRGYRLALPRAPNG